MKRILKWKFTLIAAVITVSFAFYFYESEKLKAWFYKGNHTQDGCPLVFGSQTFTHDGIFVPPEGTSSNCPLLVRVLIVGGGEPGTACDGESGEIVTAQTSVVSSVPVTVGNSGEPSKFGDITARGNRSDSEPAPPSIFSRNGPYGPDIIEGIPFNAIDINREKQKPAHPNCANKNAAGVLLNDMGPIKNRRSGFGAGGSPYSQGMPGVVFL
ncbi:MAG: hypothetical protein PHX43_08615, partial [Alphaproteobacteria bacterium]|nr:hypothetical protein [Alphaproteobacteria bacterium]